MLKTLALLAALFVAFMTAGAAVAPPPLRAAGLPGFDARAAQTRLRSIINPAVAHPVDTAAEDVVRANLVREIAALGIQPEIHERFTCRPQPRYPLIDCGYMRDIIFSLGPASGPAVLAAGHYDSVPAGPGVTDDGIGVSVLLEVARELSHAHLTRRVIFLLSDGEEQGLIGAYAFARSDPLMSDVQALIELEARGTRGPAVFFETNQPNADAVRAYAHVARPVANSIMADVYHLLPNSTDVTVLTHPGLDVINIAVLDGLENYHTPQDSFSSQDLRSVQHMGDQALAVIQAWADSTDRSEKQTLVYTDILSRVFIALPAWLALVLLGISTLVSIFAVWRAGGEHRWRALTIPLAAIVVSALLGAIVWGTFALLHRPGDVFWWAHPEVSRAWCLALGMLSAPIVMLRFGQALSARQMEAAGHFTFAALGLLMAFVMPGVSILFVIPATLYALGIVAALAWRPAQTIASVLAAIASLIIWAPMLALNELALGFQFPFANAMLFALAATPWLGALTHLKGVASWRAPALALGGIAVACIAAAALAPSATRERPLPLNISSFSNLDTHEARILAGSARRALPSEFTSIYAFTPQRILPGDLTPTWSAPARAQSALGPTLENVAVTPIADGGRELRAQVRMNGAYRVYLRIPNAAHATHVRMNGVETDYGDVGQSQDLPDYVMLGCEGRACDGADLVITLGASVTDWSIIGLTPGATGDARTAIARRPATRTPVHFGDSAITLSTLPV